MNIHTGLVAGVSITAIVAVSSIVNRTARRNRQAAVAQVKPLKSAIAPPRSASQEMPFVFGNMVLINNMWPRKKKGKLSGQFLFVIISFVGISSRSCQSQTILHTPCFFAPKSECTLTSNISIRKENPLAASVYCHSRARIVILKCKTCVSKVSLEYLWLVVMHSISSVINLEERMAAMVGLLHVCTTTILRMWMLTNKCKNKKKKCTLSHWK